MVTDRRTDYLEDLEHELDTRGLVGRVVRTRSGPAFLRVVNPAAASLAEDVTCAPAPESHDHYYWWSWGELLHRVDDPVGAARKLAHVLQPLSSEPLKAEALSSDPLSSDPLSSDPLNTEQLKAEQLKAEPSPSRSQLSSRSALRPGSQSEAPRACPPKRPVGGPPGLP